MGETDKEKGLLKRFLRTIPGRKATSGKDEGNSYEFEATIGKKGDSLGFTFDSVSQVLAHLKKGMKARVTMERKPGSSIFSARIVFVESEGEEK